MFKRELDTPLAKLGVDAAWISARVAIAS